MACRSNIASDMEDKDMRRFSTWAIVVAFIFTALNSCHVRAAPVYPLCTVGPGMDYATILAAIADANCAIIDVSPGTYYGRLNISRPLTLRSTSGASLTIIAGSSNQPYIVFISNTANVTIDGFTITYPEYNGTADASGVVVAAYNPYPPGGVTNIRITNNIIRDIGTPTRPIVSYGTIGINIGPVGGVEVDHNIIFNIHHGAATSPNPSMPIPWANGISMWGVPGRSASNITIHDNTIYDVSSPTLNDAGISMQPYVGPITIRDNVVNNTGEYGIESRGGILAPTIVEGNRISGATIAGIRNFSSFQDAIAGNTLTESASGILVEAASVAPVVHFNDIFDNTQWGLLNNSSNVTYAENNWWGHCSGPYHPTTNPQGLGNAASDNVVFRPWLRPCTLTNPMRYPPYYSLRPLAENRMGNAGELKTEVENLLKLAEERGLDTTQCRIFYEKSLKFLSDAKRFLQGGNFVAANTFAVYAENELLKARDCLNALIGA